MIGHDDRLELPDGIELSGTVLVDRVRGATVDLNESAAELVARLQRSSIREVATDIALRTGVSAERVEHDALRLCAELNQRLLANVRRGGGPGSLLVRWLRFSLALFPLGVVPALPYRRYFALEGGVGALSLGVLRSLLPRAFALACALAFALGLLLVGLGMGYAAAPVVIALAVAAFLALPAHELAHVLALRGAPCFVAARGFRVAVVHNSGRRVLVALAGPASGLLLALFALALAPVVPEAALVSVVMVSQLLGLTVLGKDGRNVCGLT